MDVNDVSACHSSAFLGGQWGPRTALLDPGQLLPPCYVPPELLSKRSAGSGISG